MVSCKYAEIRVPLHFVTDKMGCLLDANIEEWIRNSGTRKIFYRIDDVQGASEVIIVEGEMDKLSMEEAGFQNCVSVPGGAPNKVSNKELPPVEKACIFASSPFESYKLSQDVAYQYIWNCKGYLEKASRIILHADPPGQALAIELARRLGRERCWRVLWPEREGYECFVDANEGQTSVHKNESIGEEGQREYAVEDVAQEENPNENV